MLFFVLIRPKKTIANYPSSGTSVVMFGDSFTVGVGSSEGNDIPSQLSKKIGEPVINMGVSGETSAQGLARVQSVIDVHPKVVLVLFGGNDFLHRVPVSETFKNIDAIVEALEKTGSVVVLLGIQGGFLSDPYQGEFEKVAKLRKTLYVKNVLRGIIGHSDLMSDEIHPNDKGYAIIVEKIYPVLKKAF